MRQFQSAPWLWLCTLLTVWLAGAARAVGNASVLSPRGVDRRSLDPSTGGRIPGFPVPRLAEPTNGPFVGDCRYLEGPLSALEERLFADAADGRWDEHSLLTAALVAGGVDDPETLLRYETRLAELVAELRRSGTVTGPPRRQAQAILEFMHRRILVGGYQLDATDLSVALEQGRFNCVSTSVLFNYLAAQFGLGSCGLEVPGHAMNRLLLPDGTLDVETTCPGWFRLIEDPKSHADPADKTIGSPAARHASPTHARQLSRVQLVAMIYYNRAVDLLADKQFARAAAANAKALRLDPASTTARGNLLATLNNWAIDLGSRRRYAEAAQLLRQGLTLDPNYKTFKTNFVHVHHQWIEQLRRDGRFRQAIELLDAAEKTLPGEPYFHQTRLALKRQARSPRRFATESRNPPPPEPNLTIPRP